MSENKKTELYELHKELGAKLVPFAGWDMPIQYTSVKEEVLAVRNKVGVFDVSHMGEFLVEGPEALKFVDYMLTNDIAGAEMGKAIYSPLCNERGYILDDLICYKLAEDKIFICVNAANIEKDFNWLNSKANDFDIKLSNLSDKYSLLALQGPETEKILEASGFSKDITAIEYYSCVEAQLNGSDFIMARTGYTGEDGFEIFGSHDAIKSLWKTFVNDLKVTACGLAARDVLRLEVGYPLYGHEIDETITPLDGGLKWTVRLNKNSFICKEALENYTPKQRLLKIILDKGIPREGYKILQESDEPIGHVCSGTMSVVLGKGIAIARVSKEKYNSEQDIYVDIRGKRYPATKTTKPFVTGGHK